MPKPSEKIFTPKRKIPRKSNCVRGYLPSYAMGDHLRYESRSIEKKLYMFLDFLFVVGIVKAIYPQPFQIQYGSPGHIYYPDALIVFRSKFLKPWLVEGKGIHLDKEVMNRLKPKLRAGLTFSKQNGYVFHIVTQKQLDLLDDLILPFLKTHSDGVVGLKEKKSILNILKNIGPSSPEEVCRYSKEHYGSDLAVEMVWRLAAAGAIFCDLTLPPSTTRVAIPIRKNLRGLSRKQLFLLPFSLVELEHD